MGIVRGQRGKTMYNIYNIRLNSDTNFFDGLEWVIDGENGRMSYPGSWAQCTAVRYYRHGWNWDHRE